MRRDALVFTVAILIEIAGLAALLYGEQFGIPVAIYGGGTVILVGFAVMTGAIAVIDDPEETAA